MTWRGMAAAALLVTLAGCGGEGSVVAESGDASAGTALGAPGAAATPGADAPGEGAASAGAKDPSPPASGRGTPGDPGLVDLDPGGESAPGQSGQSGSDQPPPVQDPDAQLPEGEAPSGKARPGTSDTAEVVTPRAGMANVHTVGWDRTEVRSERVVRVYFYGGVAPCSVLDSVHVAETGATVTITLRSGSDPAQPDAMCIQIARYKAVDVRLREPLGDRETVDGSAK